MTGAWIIFGVAGLGIIWYLSHAQAVQASSVPVGNLPGGMNPSGTGGLIPPVSDSASNTVSTVTVDDSPFTWNMQLTAPQIAQVASAAGFQGDDLVAAVAIALAESRGNTRAVGDQNLAPSNGPSLGLWQINIGAHPEWANEDLYDPQVNAQKAFILYTRRGNSFDDWSTYFAGPNSYLNYLDQADTAVNG